MIQDQLSGLSCLVIQSFIILNKYSPAAADAAVCCADSVKSVSLILSEHGWTSLMTAIRDMAYY